MALGNIRITYLYNSGFAVETDEQLLIFDYYLDIPTGDVRRLTTGVISYENLKKKPSVTVFVSHNHADHFNPSVLRWRFKRNDINYVLSKDIDIGKNAVHVASGDVVNVSGMQIYAFPSTDAGVSYLVKVDGLSIFHAGDLNLWNYDTKSLDIKDDNEGISFRKAKIAFLKALEPIRCHTIDIAFFPVDPRIGGAYDTGAINFAQIFRPKLFVPMHFGDHYDVCESFKSRAAVPNMEVFCINARGQQYEYRL